MTPTTFIRLLFENDKGGALANAVAVVREGHTVERIVHAVDPASFRQVPGSPFAYWVSDRIRRLFTELPPFESDGRTVRQGLATADDFRFVRAWWEVAPEKRLIGTVASAPEEFRHRTYEGKTWAPFNKGGEASAFYAPIPLVVNWGKEGAQMKAWADPLYGNSGWSRIIKSTQLYFLPGLTWPLRAQSFSPIPMPRGCIFSVRGYSIIAPRSDLSILLALCSSSVFDFLFKVLLGRSGFPEFIVGVLQNLPLPPVPGDMALVLDTLARGAAVVKSNLERGNELSHNFHLPVLLQVSGDTLTARATVWKAHVAEAQKRLEEHQLEIDDIAFRVYGINGDDRRIVEESGRRREQEEFPEEENDGEAANEEEDAESPEGTEGLVADHLAYAVGCALGRWDVRFATGERPSPELPDPFAPLPVCSPGMLTGGDGLPARETPPGYPLRLDLDGILVDDAGADGSNPYRDDVVRRVREVFELLWGDRAEAIEREACEILGVRSLRDYFRRTSGFFAHHLQRYSKSRRQAPIYWPLSTASGSYTLWLYCPRLTEDLLYKAVNDYVNPKLAETGRRIGDLRAKLGAVAGREATRLREALEGTAEFQSELEELRGELLRMARLPYKPNLDDGVVICAAPLWRLFRLPKWRTELESRWKKLEAGEYDWANLAYAIWPDRVREKCKTDRSIAIAHGLEHLYEGTAVSGPRRKKRA